MDPSMLPFFTVVWRPGFILSEIGCAAGKCSAECSGSFLNCFWLPLNFIFDFSFFFLAMNRLHLKKLFVFKGDYFGRIVNVRPVALRRLLSYSWSPTGICPKGFLFSLVSVTKIKSSKPYPALLLTVWAKKH